MKSAAVRELLEKNPKMPVSEIVSTLAARRIKITPNLVYSLKTKAQTTGRTRSVRVGRNGGMASPAQLVLKVKELAVEAGGMSNLKELVEVLTE
jgi:hypothetical protein